MLKIITDECRGDIIPYDIDICSFNCGGFALGVMIWVDLIEFMTFVEENPDSENIDYAEELVTCLRNDNNIRHVRAIGRFDELEGDEYPVLFKWVPGGRDFHFIRWYKGRWVEKCGPGDIKESPYNTEELLNSDWEYESGCHYESKTYILAVDPNKMDVESTVEKVDLEETNIYLLSTEKLSIGDRIQYINPERVFTSLESAMEAATKIKDDYTYLSILKIKSASSTDNTLIINCLGLNKDAKKYLLKSDAISNTIGPVDNYIVVNTKDIVESTYKVPVYECTFESKLIKSECNNDKSDILLQKLMFNRGNITPQYYNSYGFAFQTFEDRDFSKDIELYMKDKGYHSGISLYRDEVVSCEAIVNTIVAELDGKVRVLTSPYLINSEKEYLVIMRFDPVTKETYFVVRYDGYWFEKTGKENPTAISCYLNPLTDTWDWCDFDYMKYSVKITYFAVKKGQEVSDTELLSKVNDSSLDTVQRF